MNKINKPVYLVTADIYIRFPEIMEEEYKELLEYIKDENLVYEHCTGKVLDLQNRINQAEECIKNFLCSEEYIKVDGIAIADNYAAVLEILKGSEK